MNKKLRSITKFLKKLKTLDYLIIIMVLLAGLIFYKFVHQTKKWINTTTIAYSTVFQANSLRSGDYEVDSSGKKIAVVNNLEVIDAPALAGNPFLNKILILNVAMQVDTNSRSDQIQYKNQPLAIGTQIGFDFNSAAIQGYISDIEGSNIHKTDITKTLTVIIYNQWPWFADAIHVGDYQNDAAGKKVIEVISKNVSPTQVVNVVSAGEVVDYTGSSKVDVILKLKAKLQKANSYYIFHDYNNIFIGKPITFTLGNTQINSAVVTNIE